MKFEVYNQGNSDIKAAFFCKNTFGTTFVRESSIHLLAKYNNIEIHVLDVDFLDSEASIRGSYEKHAQLCADKKMNNLYDFILKYTEENGINVCIFFGSGFPWSERFLEELKKQSYVACYFGDDPEGAETSSKHYVKNFHYAFCGGVYFDKKTRIKDKYLEWGARKSRFVPLGANPEKYSEVVNDFTSRDIDIVYVGGAYLKKIIRIFVMKKYFGDRMLIYGRGWNYRGKNVLKKITAKILKKYYRIPEIDELPKEKLVDLYQRTKIGFNMHMSYGPSNLRMYELPMNGVMQVCDCESGIKELYEIDKEVVVYKSIREAIRKIEYYLNHDEERIEIAKAGYERAKKNYRLEQSFGTVMYEIRKDIAENFNYFSRQKI